VSTFVDVANVPVQDCRIGTPNSKQSSIFCAGSKFVKTEVC